MHRKVDRKILWHYFLVKVINYVYLILPKAIGERGAEPRIWEVATMRSYPPIPIELSIHHRVQIVFHPCPEIETNHLSLFSWQRCICTFPDWKVFSDLSELFEFKAFRVLRRKLISYVEFSKKRKRKNIWIDLILVRCCLKWRKSGLKLTKIHNSWQKLQKVDYGIKNGPEMCNKKNWSLTMYRFG